MGDMEPGQLFTTDPVYFKCLSRSLASSSYSHGNNTMQSGPVIITKRQVCHVACYLVRLVPFSTIHVEACLAFGIIICTRNEDTY